MIWKPEGSLEMRAHFTHMSDISAGKSQSLGSAGSVDQHTYTYSLLVTWASLEHGGETPRRDIQIRCYKRT